MWIFAQGINLQDPAAFGQIAQDSVGWILSVLANIMGPLMNLFLAFLGIAIVWKLIGWFRKG